MKNFLLSGMFTAFLCSFIAFVTKAEELIIVKNGQQAVVVVGKNASSVEQYAARELQRTIQLMSGAMLKIENGNERIPRIVIGTPASQDEIARLVNEMKLQGAGEEQLAVYRTGNTLFLAGNTPRAALYATYTFLTDVLGARWYWPGASGEYIPERKTITIDTLQISDSPDLAIRSLAITGVPNGDPDTDTWMARNRLNLVSSRAGGDSSGKIIPVRREKGFLIRIAGHNVILPEPLLREHPEYLAEIGGKRQFHPRNASHLCWSNPAVQDEVVKMIAGWWKESPYPDIVHFYPADQTLYCQCGNCKAMGDISTRWQKFSRILIGKLEKIVPGKRYWTYAYLEYKKVPDTVPAPFELIPYALYDVSYRHLLSGNSEYNKESIAELDGWMSKGVNTGIRGYEYIIFKEPMLTPMVSWVVDQMRWAHQRGLTAYMSELPAFNMPANTAPEHTYWNCSRLALYAATRAMWNTDITAEEVVKDWCATVYGPAAEEMVQYYFDLESAWRNNPEKITLFLNSAVAHVDDIFSDPLFQKLEYQFEASEKKIRSITDSRQTVRIGSQLSLEKKMLANWKRLFELKHRNAGIHTMDTTKKGILLYDAGQDSSPLSIALQENGWDVSIESTDLLKFKPYLQTRASVMLLRYSKNGKAEKWNADTFIRKNVKRYIEKGGVVILAVSGDIPVNNWFPGVPAVKWSGAEPVKFRKTIQLQSGRWQTWPNDLAESLNKGLPPNKGFRPLSEGWETLAAIPMSGGSDAGWLLRKKIGKGWLVLTSAPMGYEGGFELLSGRNAVNVVKLIENLQADNSDK
ncbi:DUF4838 domain-containing protein [Pseudobacter ginsenosidimutans]|uniref:Glycosyl hydrolase family 67 n=1 Tax=Pseudobacter ginsenosidimutans TaxID=661488 RepID=A0A4Q7N0D7_9BACT|nr:DUF4838 domain-containing protein [Pseudobacter ginsenosidimutans]QEC43641.1 DUF4838 domain-containing protein [Pseudobacter ginsenosidimutans]RZS75040.1 glycosyl hydrolase family 67 [Pseudobacter ginsenosidimutans]